MSDISHLFSDLPLPPEPYVEMELDLGLSVEPQIHTFWCWAAVTSSVSQFLDGSNWTQCLVAGQQVEADCCSGHESVSRRPCNQLWSVARALRMTQNLVEPMPVISIDEIPYELLRRQTPLVLQMDFNGTGHIITVVGCRRGPETMVRLSDPACGESDVSLDTLKGGYRSIGRCTRVYATRRAR